MVALEPFNFSLNIHNEGFRQENSPGLQRNRRIIFLLKKLDLYCCVSVPKFIRGRQSGRAKVCIQVEEGKCVMTVESSC